MEAATYESSCAIFEDDYEPELLDAQIICLYGIALIYMTKEK